LGPKYVPFPLEKSSKPRPRNENEEEHGPEAGYIWMLKGELLEGQLTPNAIGIH